PGRVLQVFVGPGDVLNGLPTSPAVQFRPAGPLVVRAEVEQEFAGRVAAGQLAEVEDYADANLHWYGRVARVADWIRPRQSMLAEPFQRNDVRTAECVILLGTDQRLRIGQQMRVTIRPEKPQ